MIQKIFNHKKYCFFSDSIDFSNKIENKEKKTVKKEKF